MAITSVRICKPCFLEQYKEAWICEAFESEMMSGFGVEGEKNRGFCMVKFKTE
ncbi:hypothetical protein PanWU01x14_309600, partial [Parasponia andersonii]